MGYVVVQGSFETHSVGAVVAAVAAVHDKDDVWAGRVVSPFLLPSGCLLCRRIHWPGLSCDNGDRRAGCDRRLLCGFGMDRRPGVCHSGDAGRGRSRSWK